MPSYTYIGDGARVFPTDDGINPSFELEPGGTVDLEGDNPWPNLLVPTKPKLAAKAATEE